jgi:signal transduction histidine kinase
MSLPSLSLEVRHQIESSLIGGITALAYIEDNSVILIVPDRLIGNDRKLILAMPSDFVEFSKTVAGDLDSYRELFRRVRGNTLASGWINSPPFQRMMREHWYWRWYEIAEILKFACNDKRQEHILSDLLPLRQHYTKVAIRKPIMLIRSHVDFGSWTDETMSLLNSAFEQFNAVIGAHWARTSKTWDREIGARFSPKALVKAVNTRRVKRPNEYGSDPHCRYFVSAFEILSAVSRDCPLAQIAEICVLLSVSNSIGNDRQSNATLEYTQELQPIIQRIAQGHKISQRPRLSRGLSKQIEDRARLGLMSWGRYFQESLALLEARLRQHTYVSIVPMQLFLNERSKFWDRTCRFLCRVLIASEVTVYRLKVVDEGSPLELRGSFCEGPGGRGKSEYKALFMHEAAFDPEKRSRSASYRAADYNQTQCTPSRDGALTPPSDEWEWGHSVLSVPIINNGAVWGVIEFVADRPNQFGSLLVPQCEAAASLISNNLMIGSVFEALKKLDAYVLQPPSTGPGDRDLSRRTELCASLAAAFGASSLKLFFSTRDEQGRHFKVTEYGEWSASYTNLGEFDAIDYVRSFLDDTEVQSREVNSSSPPGRTRSFLVRLGTDASNAWAGALWIAVQETVDVDAVWTRNLFALGQVLAPSIANITAAHSWGPSSRREIRHENSRVINTLEGIRSGLRHQVLSKTRGEVERALARLAPKDQGEMSSALTELWRSIENAAVDLKASVDSVQLIVRALSFDIYDPLLVSRDARIIGIQKSKEQYLKKSLIQADLRDAVISALQTALRSAPDRHLRLVVPPIAPRRLLKMDPEALGAILGTLAENAAKYSAKGSDILVVFRDLNNGGLRMIMSNLAPPLSKEELEKVFDYGFRGEAAQRSHPDQGSGLGLGFAQATMEMWDGFLDYSNEAMKSEINGGGAVGHGEQLVWHRLALTFPKSILTS